MDASFVIRNKMNLYIFNQTRRGSIFGVGTYIRELTVALKGSCINVCVVNLISEKTQIQTELIDGIKHWHFPLAIADQRAASNQKQWELYFRNVVYLLQLHIKDKKDLIFHLNFFESGKLAEELKNAFGCKIVAVAHFFDWGFTIYDNPGRLRHILKEEHPDNFEENLQKTFEEEKSYYLTIDHVISLSRYMKEVLCQDYGIDTTKITIIPNGLFDVADTSNSIKHLRKKWNIPPEEQLILFAGRIDEVKGVIYLIKAFREVLKKNKDCRLIMAGSGDYDKCFQESKDIYSKITFTGLLEKQDLHELYQIVDIGVVPSLFEPFGYVAVEMMMHKLPVVVTATSGLNEVVDDTCGLKTPITVLSDRVEIDATLLSDNILYLLEHPAEAKQMGENGRRRYLNNYSSKIFSENMLNMYESCRHREEGQIKTLIVTGQNNHTWEVSHVAIRQILENSGLFTVHVAVSPKTGKFMSNFNPDFASYQLVVLDYNGDRWPAETEKAFSDFVERGGGVVVYHAANNAFRHWKEYNRIIGFGGWEERDETDGPYMYMKEGQLVYDAETPGCAGSHGPQHEFVLNSGNSEHPVTKGLPAAWRHAQDELYDRMRGPGIVKDVLYWGYSDPATKGSGRDELALFTVDYGKARIFHTTLGHAGNSLDNNTAMQCTGFQVTLLRGAEWAATGKVTQPVPDDFPTETTLSFRKTYKQEPHNMQIVPNTVLGKSHGYTAPSDKLNIAVVGIGGMGISNIQSVYDTANIVALCDVDWKYSKPVLNCFARAKKYKDFRRMYDEMDKEIDAVIVATPDHTHAIIAATAMTLGKHVYVQKPLTHSVYESRLLTRLAAEYKVATQMGNQGASDEGVDLVCEWIWNGEIGEVTKVEVATDRPMWPQGLETPSRIHKIPPTLDWDLFIGPAKMRPFNSIYHPWNWRGWWDFGTGTLGDMGCHVLHPAFKALKLGYPVSVEAASSPLFIDCAPQAEYVKFVYPEVEVHWYDGGFMPERPVGFPQGRQLMGLAGGLTIFHGTKDTLLCGSYGLEPWLLSGRVPTVPKTIRRVDRAMEGGHEQDWIRACKESPENRVKTKSDFSEAGPFNEMIMMGVLAVRLQALNKILDWDGNNMRFTNIDDDEKIRQMISNGFIIKAGHPSFNSKMSDPIHAKEFATELIKHTYRTGWNLPEMPQF